MQTLDQKFNIIQNLTSTEMRDIVLNNRELFPEFDNMSESEITKNVMISGHQMRQHIAKKTVNKKFNIVPVISVIFAIGIILLVVLVVTGNTSAEIIPAVAGLQ